MKINAQISKLNHRLPSTCTVRKDIQRKVRKHQSEMLMHPKEKSKSTSLSNLTSNVQSNLGKVSRKCIVSDSICDTLEKHLSKVEPGDDAYHLTASERHHLLESAREERKNQKFIESINTAEVYERQSLSTISVSPLVKLAYPDVHSGLCIHETDAKLLDHDPYLMR